MSGMDATDTSEKKKTAPTTSSSRSVLRFVVVFLVVALVLLSAGRYAIGGRAMDWYLFQAARHTSWLLGLVGASSDLETPQAYAGREAQVRATLEAWQQDRDFVDPDGTQEVAGQDALAPWELWQYRAGGIRRDIVRERKRLANLDALPMPGEPRSDLLLDHLRSSVSRLEASLCRDSAAPGTMPSVAGLEAFVADAKQSLDMAGRELAKPGVELEEQGLLEFAEAAEQWRENQVAFVERHLAGLNERQTRLGPMVSFTARFPNSPSQAGQDPQNAPGPSWHFRFNLVPDCGAIPSMSIFLAAVLAFPVPWWRRVFGIAAGLPILYCVNITRLACLAHVGAWDNGGKWFVFAHEYVWQGIYVVFVVGIWLVWVDYIVRPDPGWRAGQKGVVRFCLRFLVAAPVCLAVYWAILPGYAWCVGQASVAVLTTFAGFPLDNVIVERAGALNTQSVLKYTGDGLSRSIPIGQLVTNTAPFIALVLATGGLGLVKRVWALIAGIVLLAACHTTFLVFAFSFSQTISRSSQIPMALGQLVITLPFLLWIVLGFWRRPPKRTEGAPQPETGE